MLLSLPGGHMKDKKGYGKVLDVQVDISHLFDNKTIR
jgi:hypothetical protein